jgi:hypothetical protein
MNVVNLTSTFVDLATFNDREKDLYGGDYRSLFTQNTKKYNWMSMCPTTLYDKQEQNTNIITTKISRAGDYLLSTWLTAKIPKIVLSKQYCNTAFWAKNLGHNLIKKCVLKNAQTGEIYQEFDSFYLDFWTAFTVPSSKSESYSYAIGNREKRIYAHRNCSNCSNNSILFK